MERVAWFDANGDGRIDTRSMVEGGDGYIVGDGNNDGRVDVQAAVYPPIVARSRPVSAADLPHPSGEGHQASSDAPAAGSALHKRAEAAYRAAAQA